MTPTGALSTLKVIDASRVLAGPMAGQILADHGANVIKLEPPGMDDTRSWGPPWQGGTASYFQGLNRNKRAIAVDLTKPEGREILLRLLEDADVFLENFKIGTLEKWGIGTEVLQARFPRLIHARVSGFGADGPRGGHPGYDAAVQAVCGLMSVNGAAGGEPVRMGVPVVDLVTGLNTALGISLALNERARSGRGQFLELALYDCGFSVLHPQLANYHLDDKVPGLVGNAHPNISPYDCFRTKTVPIFLAVGNNRQFATLTKMIGLPDAATDPRFATNGARSENRAALKPLLETALATFEGEALERDLIAAGVPCGAVRTIDQVVADPHTHHRGMVVEIGAYRGTGSPIKLSRTPASYRNAPPGFAEHTAEVLAEHGLAVADHLAVLPGLAPQTPAQSENPAPSQPPSRD